MYCTELWMNFVAFYWLMFVLLSTCVCDGSRLLVFAMVETFFKIDFLNIWAYFWDYVSICWSSKNTRKHFFPDFFFCTVQLSVWSSGHRTVLWSRQKVYCHGLNTPNRSPLWTIMCVWTVCISGSDM